MNRPDSVLLNLGQRAVALLLCCSMFYCAERRVLLCAGIWRLSVWWAKSLQTAWKHLLQCHSSCLHLSWSSLYLACMFLATWLWKQVQISTSEISHMHPSPFSRCVKPKSIGDYHIVLCGVSLDTVLSQFEKYVLFLLFHSCKTVPLMSWVSMVILYCGHSNAQAHTVRIVLSQPCMPSKGRELHTMCAWAISKALIMLKANSASRPELCENHPWVWLRVCFNKREPAIPTCECSDSK